MEKPLLRKTLLQARSALSITERTHAEHALTQQLLRLPLFTNAKRIGSYLKMGSEISLETWMHHPSCATKQFFVPGLHPTRHKGLQAHPWDPNTPLQINRLRFLAPAPPKQPIPWWTLDIILIPLLAFDKKGARLGRGGGFYDILLDELDCFTKKPTCIGVAFDFQEVAAVPTAAHDRPLDGIITPTQWIKPT